MQLARSARSIYGMQSLPTIFALLKRPAYVVAVGPKTGEVWALQEHLSITSPPKRLLEPTCKSTSPVGPDAIEY